jgi:neutral ceramidase
MSSKARAQTLSAGTATVDITPPLEVGLLTSSVKGQWAAFESVRKPLKARVIVLTSGTERVAIVSLDLLGLTGIAVGGWEKFKRALSKNMSPKRVVISCTHSHNAPESVAITDLYKTAPFRAWITELEQKVAAAISEAAANSRPCSVAIGATELTGYSLQRRILTEAGIIMSDSVQPISPELMNRGPVDRRVHSVQFLAADGTAIATIVHAICHPVHEMCMPHISPDFPGELCEALDTTWANGLTLFLNGAAGDTNPPTVSCGPDDARRHGLALADTVKGLAGKLQTIAQPSLAFAHREILLPTQSVESVANADGCVARLSAIRVGSLAFVFLPGEPFIETALAMEAASPFEHTIVAGFSDSSIGYVPPQHAFVEGGYEIGPGKWSFLQEGADLIIRAAVSEMLNELAEAPG